MAIVVHCLPCSSCNFGWRSALVARLFGCKVSCAGNGARLRFVHCLAITTTHTARVTSALVARLSQLRLHESACCNACFGKVSCAGNDATSPRNFGWRSARCHLFVCMLRLNKLRRQGERTSSPAERFWHFVCVSCIFGCMSERECTLNCLAICWCACKANAAERQRGKERATNTFSHRQLH